MSKQPINKETLDQLIAGLKQQRDKLAGKIHLGKTEVKQEWEKVEKKVGELTAQYKPVVEKTGESVLSAVESAALEVKKGLDRVNKLLKPSKYTGRVLNIQRYCSHDGPGIRTTVFLKGCSLRCKWCSNPESIRPKPELAYEPRLCTGKAACGLCLKEPFPEGAFYVVDGADDKILVNWDLATDCDEETVALCPTDALYMFGKEMSVEEVIEEVARDESFYRNTGGGMTLSGGECLLQPDFTAALLEEAHKNGFNTAIETACNVPWRFVEQVLPHVDTMLHDHKLTIPERHKKWTGVDNKRILENFKKAYETFPNIDFIARTPLIPGVNDDEEHIRAVLDFIRPHKNVIDYELLPYHRFGTSKYEFLGKVYELSDFTTPSEESVQRLQDIIDKAFGRGKPEGAA